MPVDFGPRSTADDVLADVDLKKKRFLVTGVSSGIGLEAACALVSRGADVVGTVRDTARAAQAMRPVCDAAPRRDGSLDLAELDLASLASVRRCADLVSADSRRFDGIIANAGVLGMPFGLTADGFELHFGTNYIGHFALLHRLAPLIKDGGRLVTTSSQAHRSADVDLDDPHFERRNYDPWIAYARSKTANALLAAELDRRHRGRSVRAASVESGITATRLDRQLSDDDKQALFARVAGDRMEAGLPPAPMKTAQQGAATPVWAAVAVATDPDAIGGRYLENCAVAPVDDSPNPFADGVRSYALAPDRAGDLWVRSEAWIGAT